MIAEGIRIMIFTYKLILFITMGVPVAIHVINAFNFNDQIQELMSSENKQFGWCR